MSFAPVSTRSVSLWMVGAIFSMLDAQTVMVVQEGGGKVLAFPSGEPSRAASIAVGDKPHEIEVDPSGDVVYVSNFGLLEANHKAGTPGTTISVLDVKRQIERTRFRLPEGFTAPHGLKLRPREFAELFTNAEEGTEGMVVFDAHTGAVLRTFPLPPGVHNFVFNEGGSALFAFTMKGEVCRIDPESGAITACVRTGSPRGLAWSADKSHLIASGKGELLFLDAVTLSVAKRFTNLGVGQIFYPATTPDGRWILAPAVLDGVILVLDANTGAVKHGLETGSPLSVTFDEAGKHAWVSNVLVPAGLFGPETKPRDGGITRIDLETFEMKQIPGIPDVNGLAIVPSPKPSR